MSEVSVEPGVRVQETSVRSPRRWGKWAVAAGLTLAALPAVGAFADLAAGWMGQSPDTYVEGVTDRQIMDVVGRDIREALPVIAGVEAVGLGLAAAGFAATRRLEEA